MKQKQYIPPPSIVYVIKGHNDEIRVNIADKQKHLQMEEKLGRASCGRVFEFQHNYISKLLFVFRLPSFYRSEET